MRWLLAALALLAPGCIDPSVDAFEIGRQDCSSSQQAVTSADTDVLLPSSVPDDVRESFGPLARITVHAREGQTLQAVATWVEVAGDVEVLFDGPGRNVVESDNGWVSTGVVGEGDYTLELAGSPMAYDVTYTLYLAAIGCTPAED